LAIGQTSDVAKEGYASGYSYNAKTMEDARATAMDYCHKSPTNQKVRSLCKVIETFSNRCVAVSLDPKAGTPGAGWGIGDDLRAAERQALSRCEATAGPARRAACVVTQSDCDGQASAANRCETPRGDAAIAACDEAIRKSPQSAVNYNNRGFEYRNKDDADRALADCSGSRQQTAQKATVRGPALPVNSRRSASRLNQATRAVVTIDSESKELAA
jgi:hypothetical protein